MWNWEFDNVGLVAFWQNATNVGLTIWQRGFLTVWECGIRSILAKPSYYLWQPCKQHFTTILCLRITIACLHNCLMRVHGLDNKVTLSEGGSLEIATLGSYLRGACFENSTLLQTYPTPSPSWVRPLRASPTALSMWLQKAKFIVKISKCARLAQEISFSAPN
jgi:hypothetical protein